MSVDFSGAAAAFLTQPYFKGIGNGKIMGDDGWWSYEYDAYRDVIVLINDVTRERKEIPRSEFRAGDFPRARQRYKRPLPSRETRWERRMVRMRQKRWERRMRPVHTAAWVLAWTWGSVAATIITVKLFSLLNWSVLG